MDMADVQGAVQMCKYEYFLNKNQEAPLVDNNH